MDRQGSLIVNGEKVEGRILSFDDEGVKVSNGEEEKVVVPNEFDFAEEVGVDESDFVEIETPNGKITYNKDIFNKKPNKKLFIAIGAAFCVGLVVGGVILKKKKG